MGLRVIAGATAAVLLQWLVFSRLRMFGAYPDIALLYVAWAAIRYGRVPGCLVGAAVGLLIDFIFGTWGVHMCLKSLMGFLIGMVPSGQQIGLSAPPWRVWIAVLSAALVHNGMLVVFIVVQSGVRVPSLLSVDWLGGALYTSFAGALIAMVTSGRSRRTRRL